MTNGEKIKEIFPDAEISIVKSNYVRTKVAVDWKFEQIPSYYNLFYEDWWNAEYKEPSTKNNLAQERYQDLIEYFGDEKVSKIILENRGQFKAWLERLRWHVKRADELARELELLKGTTKNDLGVDCISRADARKAIIDHQYSANFCEEHNIDHSINTGMALIALSDLPPVTSQEPRWIPVSERLPEAIKNVLVTSVGGYVYISRLVHGEWEYGGEVVAWMPLPQPYREVEE